MFSLPLAISAVAVLVTYAVAAWQDWRTRTVYRVTWYPAAVIGSICGILFWNDAIHLPGAWLILVLSLFFAALFALSGYLRLFGAADAKALVLLSLAVPVTPFADWIFPSLAVSSVINAGLLSLTIPLVCLLYNLAKKNHAPFWILCSGFPVRGEDVSKYHGFLAEEFGEIDGRIVRRYRTVRESVFALKNDDAELELARRCDTVWITIGIPLLVPLTAGLVFAMGGVSAVDAVLSLIV